MCRNHRGFVESLIAATRIGADVLLLNTSFAGPALAEVVNREHVDVVIYDEEFTDLRRPGAGRPARTPAGSSPGWTTAQRLRRLMSPAQRLRPSRS